MVFAFGHRLIEAIQSAYRADARKVLEIDYAVKALPKACQSNSPIYNDILSKLLLAPTFSFLNGLEAYISGLYYLSPLGYIISSPADLVTNIHKDAIPIMQTRPYWLEAKSGKSVIRLTGPVMDVATNKLVLTISTGLFGIKINLKGWYWSILLFQSCHRIELHYINTLLFQVLGKDPLPENAWLPRKVLIGGVKTNQVMYFKFDSGKRSIFIFCKRKNLVI